mgnify:CR=1 FL=1
MATPAQWWQGARPRTLPAAVAPVAVGTGIALHAGVVLPVRALLALVVACALQVGVNFANDYSDGRRGTDENRVGPVRLVGQRLASPGAVRTAAFVCFGVAGLAGIALAVLTHALWLVVLGAVCIVAAWGYTGGSRPYGYRGWGEVAVLVFFGIVPVMGTVYVQLLAFPLSSLVGGIGIGALACAILVTNNLRDRPGDALVGKITVAVRLGDGPTRRLYELLVAIGVLTPIALGALTSWWVALGSVCVVLAVRPVRTVASGALGPALIPALKQTGTLLLAVGLLTGVLLAVS